MAFFRDLRRYLSVFVNNTASNPIPITGEITSEQGPTQFVKDTVDTEVNLDTATPANNEPLPTNLYNEDGERGVEGNTIEVSATGTLSSYATIPASTTSVLLISATAKRVQTIITNTSNKRLWISTTTPALTTVPRYLDKDETMFITTWRGAFYGIWDTGATSGSADIEEIYAP